MIKDVEPNKYVLEADKSPDPGYAPHEPMKVWPGSRDLLFLNFGTYSITFERKKLDTSFFLC